MSDAEYRELLKLYLEGTIDEHSSQRLSEHLNGNPELLNELAGSMEVDRMLSFLGTYEADTETFRDEVVHRISQPNDTIEFTPNVIDRIESKNKWRNVAIWAAAAAVIFFAAFIGMYQFIGNDKTAKLPHFATITSLESISGEQSHPDFAPGDRLPNELISFERGVFELETENGSRLLIEGPAIFQFTKPKRLDLKKGKVTIEVVDEDKGFKVKSPTSEIIDLGTIFSTSVTDDGTTEVHVSKGHVKAREDSMDEFVDVRKGNALRMEDGTAESVEFNPSQFIMSLPQLISELPAHYFAWHFEEKDGDRLTTSGKAPRPVSTILKGEKFELPSFVDRGAVGQGIKLDGKDDFIETDLKGVSGSNARTFAFWVKADISPGRENTLGRRMAILSYGNLIDEKGMLISLHPRRNGVLSINNSDKKISGLFGTTDLMDNRFHHVAIVLYHDDKTGNSSAIVYIDGEFETLAHSPKPFTLNTDTDSPTSDPILFGRSAMRTAAGSSRPATGNMHFKGLLDELYVFDEALSGEAIRKLLESDISQGK